MTRKQALKELDESVADFPKSVDLAIDRVMSTLKWLNHIAEFEYSPRDKERVLFACRAFYGDIRPLTAKYIDGE
jgi:hypothetical protein